MVRMDILKKYIEKDPRSWEQIAHEVGRLPATLEAFELLFMERQPETLELHADTLETLMLELKMPASVAGYVFFADPEQDENSEKPDCICGSAEPKNWYDVLIGIFEDLDLKARIKLLTLAYELHDQKEAAKQ